VQVTANENFTATLVDPAGDIEYLGARVEVPVTREIVSFWRVAELTGATWTVEMESPILPGDYLLVWRTGDPEPPDYETFIPLTVVAAGIVIPVPFDVVTVEDVRPTIEDIVALEQTRTAAGGGGEIREFTDSTRPSSDEVENLIDQAVGAVLNQISEPRFSDGHFDGVRHAISLYTAMLIEGGYFREGLDSSAVDLWRTLFNQAIVNLQNSVQEELRQARLMRSGLV
jgi:hypothetical protein